MPRKSIGETAMTDAERQARYRAARTAGVPIVRTRRPTDHRGRARRWTDHVTGLVEAQVEFAAWLESLPDNLQDSATAERCARSAIWTSANFRRSFRRAASVGTDQPPSTLTHVRHRDLPRPSLRATPKALRYGRGSLLCMTWISPRQRPKRGRDWTRKGGRNWKRFDTWIRLLTANRRQHTLAHPPQNRRVGPRRLRYKMQ